MSFVIGSNVSLHDFLYLPLSLFPFHYRSLYLYFVGSYTETCTIRFYQIQFDSEKKNVILIPSASRFSFNSTMEQWERARKRKNTFLHFVCLHLIRHVFKYNGHLSFVNTNIGWRRKKKYYFSCALTLFQTNFFSFVFFCFPSKIRRTRKKNEIVEKWKERNILYVFSSLIRKTDWIKRFFIRSIVDWKLNENIEQFLSLFFAIEQQWNETKPWWQQWNIVCSNYQSIKVWTKEYFFLLSNNV